MVDTKKAPRRIILFIIKFKSTMPNNKDAQRKITSMRVTGKDKWGGI
jgi:hypothetical protein